MLETTAPLAGAASLRGSSSGKQGYLHYFHTNSDELPLKAGTTYRLTLSYRIVEEGDKGFEVMFHSPTGGRATEDGMLLLADGTAFGTDPAVISLPKLTTFRLSFDYRVLVGDIVIEQGRPQSFAAEPATYDYLENAPFPRLGNYLGTAPTEEAAWGGYERVRWHSSVEAAERRLALFDVIFGFSQVIERFDPDGNPDFRYDRGLSPQWLVKDAKGEPVDDLGYPGILKLDISPEAERDASPAQQDQL